MKKLYALFGFAAVSGLMFFSFEDHKPAQANTGGSLGGYSGSIGDARTCGTNGGCHGGGSTVVSNAITSDIPGTGYVPGQTYNVSVTVSDASSSKFGFEATAEDGTGTQQGTMIAGTGSQLISSGTGAGHVTHTSSGLGTAGSATWDFQWTAPSSDQGDITFFSAMNASNGQSNTSGDVIYQGFLTVSADNGVGVDETSAVAFNLSVFPNPASEYITLEFGLAEAGRVQAELIDMQGKKVRTLVNSTYASGNQTVTVDLDNLPEGNYFVRVLTENGAYTEKVLLL